MNCVSSTTYYTIIYAQQIFDIKKQDMSMGPEQLYDTESNGD